MSAKRISASAARDRREQIEASLGKRMGEAEKGAHTHAGFALFGGKAKGMRWI